MSSKVFHDVIVVGSGASGSLAVKTLTEQGLDVLLFEAGRDITSADFPQDLNGPQEKGMQLWARIQASLTGQPLQSRVAMYGKQQRHLFVKDNDHPYSTPKGRPYLWIRGKQLGGRLHTFGRVLLRWSDADFKAASRDGEGTDWPISYADIAPYYEKVEKLLDVRGNADDVPSVPSGSYAGPTKLVASEQDFKTSVENKWPERRAIAWRFMPPNAKRIPLGILHAKETGKLTIRSNAVVRRILTDPATGKATGVEFIDTVNGTVETAQSRSVVVAASAIESVRLLLNSAGNKHPHGLGNSSGVLGRYFFDQVPCIIMGTVPNKHGAEIDDTLEPDPFYGRSGGVYIPRYENVKTQTNSNFKRGFGFQGTVGRMYVPKDRPMRFAMMGFGEMLPHRDNRITLHPTRKDKWGMPLPHIDIAMRDNELAVLKAQSSAIKQMSDAAGLETQWLASQLGLQEFGRGAFPDADFVSRMLFRMNIAKSMSLGAAIHESGGVRMGDDLATSVLNTQNQMWDAPNVFVTDAASFVTGGCSGTTLTLMALTIRASQYLAHELKAGKL
jgi:choline dehydrogenase-like flavoprotein